MDAISVKFDHMRIKNALRMHLDALDDIMIFKSALRVFVPENNLANEGSHMWNMIKGRANIKAYYQKEGVVGVYKGRTTADDYQYTFNVKLKGNAIWFDSQFFTRSPGHNTTSIKGLAREQLERYHVEYEEPKRPGGKAREIITGKTGNEQDDLAIAVLMGPFWSRAIMKNESRLNI